MKKQLGQAWRVVACAFAFTVFGVFGLAMSLLVFPLLFLFPLGKSRREFCARAIIGACFRRFTALLSLLRLMRCHPRNMPFEPGAGPRVIIANHPALTDVVYLVSHLPQCTCIVKLGVWRNPCMHLPVRAAGYIPNRDTEQLITDSVTSLKGGRSVLIFPEGTRSHPNRLRPFHRGFAAMALRGDAAVQPIVITCTPPTLSKGRPWYRMADRCCDLILHAREPVVISPFTEAHRNASLAARTLTASMERFYQEELRAYYATC